MIEQDLTECPTCGKKIEIDCECEAEVWDGK